MTEEQNLTCVCAAHLGVPLNIIFMHQKGVIYDPVMTLGTKDLRISPILKKTNLYYNTTIFVQNEKKGIHNTGLPPEEGFRISYPKGIAYRYLTKKGMKSNEAYHMHSACIVFCCELAAKKVLVGPPQGGGVLTHQEGNVKHFGTF